LRILSPARISRRAFLGASAALAAGLATGCARGDGPNTLNFYNYPNYIAPDTIANFETAYGVRVTYDNYSAQDTLEAKLRIGQFGYDLVVASDYKVARFIKTGIIQQLDQARIPNLHNLFSWVRENPYDPGNHYAVPWQWGTTGIGYNTAAVTKPVTGWGSLWDAQFAGRISMLSERRECIAAALLLRGYSVNSVIPAQLDEARDLLLEQQPLLRHYTSDTYIDELASEDLLLAQGWSGDVFQAIADNPNVSYVIPREGSMLWVDSMCIPRGAPHKEVAETFMNYVLEPKVGADLSNAIEFATPNRAALPYIRPEDRDNPLIYPPESARKRLEFLQDLGQHEVLWNRVWDQVLLGARP